MVDIIVDKEEVKKAPKHSGFFIAAWFWFVAVMLFYLPSYFGELAVFVIMVITVLGWLFICISLIGIAIELSYLIKNEGFSYWGASLAFLLPTIALHYYQNNYLDIPLWVNIIKTAIVLLLIVGSGLFFYGMSYLFEGTHYKKINGNSDEKSDNHKVKNKKNLETTSTIIVAILTIATAIIQLLRAI